MGRSASMPKNLFGGHKKGSHPSFKTPGAPSVGVKSHLTLTSRRMSRQDEKKIIVRAHISGDLIFLLFEALYECEQKTPKHHYEGSLDQVI
jgi:hypothetical protein